MCEPDHRPPRFVPERPFPPYSYVTGRFPHPVNDPRGHSFGQPAQVVPAIDPQRWQESREYLFGIDLFNHGYYWEAHETWEGLWHACGRAGPTGDFLKGLIKLAAAGVKAREGRPQGVRNHSRRAMELFRKVRGQLGANERSYLGLDFDELIRAADELLAEPPVARANAEPVEIVFPFRLLPAAVDRSGPPGSR